MHRWNFISRTCLDMCMCELAGDHNIQGNNLSDECIVANSQKKKGKKNQALIVYVRP